MLVVFFLMENGIHGTQLMGCAWEVLRLMWKLHLLCFEGLLWKADSWEEAQRFPRNSTRVALELPSGLLLLGSTVSVGERRIAGTKEEPSACRAVTAVLPFPLPSLCQSSLSFPCPSRAVSAPCPCARLVPSHQPQLSACHGSEPHH